MTTYQLNVNRQLVSPDTQRAPLDNCGAGIRRSLSSR
jgi:hypothetical protein